MLSLVRESRVLEVLGHCPSGMVSTYCLGHLAAAVKIPPAHAADLVALVQALRAKGDCQAQYGGFCDMEGHETDGLLVWRSDRPVGQGSMEVTAMASRIVNELRATTDAVWARLSAQLHGMERYMERSDAPGEWTTRQVLCHLLFEPGWRPGPVLFSFATTDLPVIEIKPGQVYLNPERQMMTLRQFENALERHRQEALAYLETLGDEDLQRKARIPLFKPLLGSDEITMPTWARVLFAIHWGDHADQLAKIRKAVGLPEATALVTAT